MTDKESAWGPGENPEDFPTRASRRRGGGRDASTGPFSEVPRFADRFSPPEQAPRTAPDAEGEPTVRRPVLDIRLDENAPTTWTTTVPVTVPVPPPAEQPQVVRTENGRSAAAPAQPNVPHRPTRKTADAPEGRRRSFLAADTGTVPAETGFRGFITKFGLRIPPSKRELTQSANTREVSQHWPGPRTISVVNGKGGANKTPTTVMLASVLARNGGGPVLAWDNNETRGTLGWRTEQGPHNSTVMDLLPQTDQLLAPSAQSALLARYVHHQIEDKYDVLRSKPDVLASEQKVTSDDFDALHEVASKYFRLNIVDSGNDETAERWLRMIHHTDQLVIATTTLEEHAEAGALLLEALRARGGKYEELSQNAVVIVSQSDKNGTAAQAQAIADGFHQLARHAVTIPYDVALLKGRIRWGSLRPPTQRAWFGAAAAVAEGL
ncbi:hypothetical protein [Arthrobacter sp. H5]|uniref:MinD/ParA family ATP-binding protein n=1 Tax=Arthrobacter sp. H5 TaxID=1267973 RepID=UPI000487DDD6|nr:hypothetical protein [Arthrobacter sp. H5]